MAYPLPIFLLQKPAGDIWGLGVESRSWGGVQPLSLSLPFPLRAPGTETPAAPCPREGSARIPTWSLGKAGVTWPYDVEERGNGRPRLAGAAAAAPHRSAQGLQVHFQAGPTLRSALCAGRPACALPAGGAGLARRTRPSLRQWVWTRVGKEGEGRLCLLSLPL